MKTIDKRTLDKKRHRNRHLYEDGLIELVDYIICPITQIRMVMIKNNYITDVLGFTVEEFDEKFPNYPRMASQRKVNISNGLRSIDQETCISKHELSVIKSKETLNTIGSDGLSGYKRKGQKTRTTHMNNIDEYGRNGYSQLASRAIVKGNTTKREKGLIIPSHLKGEYYRYKTVVLYITNRFRKEVSKDFNVGKSGGNDIWHVDHRFSILEGYLNQISPIVIGDRENLEMLPWMENIQKNTKCSILKEDLLSTLNYTHEKSKEEFDFFINLIREDIENNVTPRASSLIEKWHESII